MSGSRAARLGPTRAEVLHYLRTVGEPVAVAEVAAAVGLHPNTTRFHLDALTDSGLVTREVEQRNQPGRPKLLYRAVEGHRSNRYQELAGAMVLHFAGMLEDRSELAEAAGEAWGNELRTEAQRTGPAEAPLDRLVGCMAGLGYDPTLVADSDTVVELRPCPYLELADKDPQVTCQLHLGLVRGLLGPDQPWQVTAIEPWVTPTKCLLRLAQTVPEERGPIARRTVPEERCPASVTKGRRPQQVDPAGSRLVELVETDGAAPNA